MSNRMEINAMTYLEKKRIEESIDLLRQDHAILTLKSKGTKCSKCGILQGSKYKGFDPYYCNHLSHSIDKKLRVKNKKVLRELLNWFTSYSITQGSSEF